MANFYRIQIDSIHLTKTGLAGGLPCKLAVAGADALFQTRTGQTTQAADGTPYAQIVNYAVGKPLEIQIVTLMESVWNQLVALVNSSLENGTTVSIVGTGGALGNFAASAQPLLPKPFAAQEFHSGRVKNAVFRFITV